jgi:hypothetical protein
MLGASPHSDLLAHLYGLVAGLIVGLVATIGIGRSSRMAPVVSTPAAGTGAGVGSVSVQIACALLTLFIVLGSWVLAFQMPR